MTTGHRCASGTVRVDGQECDAQRDVDGSIWVRSRKERRGRDWYPAGRQIKETFQPTTYTLRHELYPHIVVLINDGMEAMCGRCGYLIEDEAAQASACAALAGCDE